MAEADAAKWKQLYDEEHARAFTLQQDLEVANMMQIPQQQPPPQQPVPQQPQDQLIGQIDTFVAKAAAIQAHGDRKRAARWYA